MVVVCSILSERSLITFKYKGLILNGQVRLAWGRSVGEVQDGATGQIIPVLFVSKESKEYIVLKLDGNLEIGAHVRSNLCYLFF